MDEYRGFYFVDSKNQDVLVLPGVVFVRGRNGNYEIGLKPDEISLRRCRDFLKKSKRSILNNGGEVFLSRDYVEPIFEYTQKRDFSEARDYARSLLETVSNNPRIFKKS